VERHRDDPEDHRIAGGGEGGITRLALRIADADEATEQGDPRL
jgi:hypothetical protein